MKTIDLLTIYGILIAVVIVAWHYSKNSRKQLYKSFKAHHKLLIRTLDNKYNNIAVNNNQIKYCTYTDNGTSKLINLRTANNILLDKYYCTGTSFSESKNIKLPIKGFQNSLKSYKRGTDNLSASCTGLFNYSK